MVKEAYPFFILSSIVIFFIYFGRLFHTVYITKNDRNNYSHFKILVESCLKYSPIA